MTASWAIKIGRHILKTGGRISQGSGAPFSTRTDRGAFLHLLQNISTLY